MELLGEILGVEAAEQALESLSPSVTVRAVEAAAKELAERVREQFLTGGVAFGSGWLPDKKQPQRHPTLIVTGALMQSFGVIEEDENQILFGSTLSYARYSEYGTSREPARKVLTPELLEGVEVEL